MKKPVIEQNWTRLETGAPLVQVENVSRVIELRTDKTVILDSLNFTVPAHSLFAINGPSGSGKSTILNILTGIDRPSSGRVVFAGEELRAKSENALAKWRGHHVGIVFQFFQLIPTLTAFENVLLALELGGSLPWHEWRKRALDCLETVGIAEFAHRQPAQLSGGQQQRVAIARALANNPPVIVADEPTGNLDSRSAQQVFETLDVVLSRLSKRLETTFAPDAVLSTIVETVAQALKLPYTAIVLEQNGTSAIAASFGQSGVEETNTHFPLLAQSETVGELVLAPRTPGEAFTTGDLRLLHDLTYQVGIAVNALRLTANLQQMAVDLQQSRERIVLAREEERRRLRRDLHDDLGPTLAALALSATTVGDLIPTDPDAAVRMANELQREIRNTVGNVRRLVYDLRPPTLDELGLIAAIRERAVQLSNHPGGDAEHNLQILVKAPEKLPVLPAAVEVAAYRIVQEALTNVTRHAHAYNCLVRLSLLETSGMLQIEIIDDGIGLSAERHTGVGLFSMRERAEELGGSCTIEKHNGSGTRVCAQLFVREKADQVDA